MKYFSFFLVALLVMASFGSTALAQSEMSEFTREQRDERREYLDEQRDERREYLDESHEEREEYFEDRRSGETEMSVPDFMQERNEERREFFDDEREERKDFFEDQHEERRIFLEERKDEDRIKIHEHVLERFEQTLENLTNIEDRLESRIADLEAKGYDVATAQTAWREGRAELDNAAGLVATLASLFDAELPENEDEPDYSDVRTQIANIQESFMSIRSYFRESVELLKSSISTGVIDTGVDVETEAESVKPEPLESEEIELSETL